MHLPFSFARPFVRGTLSSSRLTAPPGTTAATRVLAVEHQEASKTSRTPSLPVPSSQIILLGLRGSGKSTLGRLLAARLVTDFVDLDLITAELLRAASPAEAIQTLGLPAFRDAEVRALQMPRTTGAGVLALGGGTPTARGAIPVLSALKARGARLIYLRGTPETLRSRLRETDLASRPSLTGAPVLDEVERLFAERDPLYLSLAEKTVEIDGRSVEQSLEDLAAVARTPRAT